MLRKGDGSEVVARASPYPLVLHQLLAQHHWDKATKLCHAVKVNLSSWWYSQDDGVLAVQLQHDAREPGLPYWHEIIPQN
jgi:hypothetical protein